MDIGILHLTDIHFTKFTDLGSKTLKLGNILKNELYHVNTLYVVISGDIANTGKFDEYSKAKVFLSSIVTIFSDLRPDRIVKIILVPGNHDCNFELNNDLRENIIKNISYENIGNDNTVIDASLTVQNDFWGFYGFYNPIPEDKIFYKIEDNVLGKKVSFLCLNTAWMSKKTEEAGSLFFPVRKYMKLLSQEKENSNINIAIWHHPINWFSPNTKENNKKEFQNFIETIAPMHLYGHEHENEHYHTFNKVKNVDSHLFAGKVFQDQKNPKTCGFQIFQINLDTKASVVKSYSWGDEHFNLTHSKTFDISREERKFFILQKDYLKELDEIKIPLLFDKKDIKLSDIYVFPDLESIKGKDLDALENFMDSSKLLESESKNSILDGESQIGKTALLCSYFLKFYRDGFTPIMINGEDVKDLGLEKIIRRNFQRQYQNGFKEFDRYMQMDVKKRILLIDDYNNSTLNTHSTKLFLDDAIAKFGKVIITTESTHSILPTMQNDFDNWRFYTIKPLGYKKRNDLIELFHQIKENPITFDEEVFLQETKISFDNVQAILGNKLMPSYPIFILSILQALEYKPMQHQETSFGYCYQTLIHYSLNTAGVTNDYIDTYFNFLTELAFFLISKKAESLTRNEFDDFYNSYQNDYNIPRFENLFKTLIKSKIISSKEDKIKFGYKYILYYLSAKKISDIIHKDEGKKMINLLFDELHLEQNANILVFITHHSKDISFIEESMINSMVILDNVNPITLKKDDKFYSEIQMLAEEVKQDVLDSNKNPRDERNKYLKLKDERERESNTNSDEEDQNISEQTKSLFIPFQKSLRLIEIIGQIIRNRKGSLTKKQLLEMTREIYTTGFRTVSFISEILENNRKDIISAIIDEMDGDETKHELTERINLMIQMMCLQTCFGIFNKLTYSIGNKDLKDLYTQVAEEMDTPASKLVSFGINSYYGSMSIEELSKISNELKGNIVATNLLKAKVKSYVYNKKIDFRTKQKIADILSMKINPHVHNKSN